MANESSRSHQPKQEESPENCRGTVKKVLKYKVFLGLLFTETSRDAP